VPARLKDLYDSKIQAELKEEFGLVNVMEVPLLEKVVVNMGVGDAIGDPRLLETAAGELSMITGQKAGIRKAKKSISNFKLRAGVPIACMVTLRGQRMYEFIDRLVNVALPRVRDFRGVSPKGFDANGNYTLGLREQTIFPEVDMDKVANVRGMNVTFVTKFSRDVDANRALLRKLGMPFAN
jgi:large subunit ribosomal protein L5